MKHKKSPIELSHLYFTDYTRSHLSDPSFTPAHRDFDLRHDFLIDKDFAGIAAELHFHNTLHDKRKGVRRKVSLLLFDATDRVLIASRQIAVRISASDFHTRIVAAFPLEETEFRSGHAYRLQVRDDNASLLLGEGCFRTYMEGRYGDPATWYEPLSGGLVPDRESVMLKSCDRDSRDIPVYRIRFEVMDALRGERPDVMPELEVRLYSPAPLIHDPDGDNVMVDFIQPRNAYQGDFTSIVEIPIGPRLSDGVYYVELLCMDAPIAGFVFTTDREIEGSWTGADLLPLDEYDRAAANRRFNQTFPPEESGSSEVSDNWEDPFDPLEDIDILAELDNLTGLETVKEKIRSYDTLMRFCMLRASKGLELFHAPLHAMFLGSPGTGKTTVAKLMGMMLKKAGVLSRGHVVARERSTLLGEHYHSEAEKTLAAIDEAQGGILFIDEAHSLFQPHDPKDPGKFVIETLLTALADPEKDDWMLILAGYPDEMQHLFKLNPGFKSRIPESNIYLFEDYDEEQLMESAERRLGSLDFSLSGDARDALRQRLATDYAQRDRSFGNARHVRNLVETEILPAMARRVMAEGLSDPLSLTEVQAADIPLSAKKEDPSRRRPLGFRFPSAS